jgi:hypothetical protein
MSTYTKIVRPRVVGEDPECAQHHKVQTMDPNRVAVKHVWETMTNILRKLIRHPYAHLTDEDLKHLKIKCTGLDFNTGMPADGSEVFIRPIPINRTHEILERSSPWLKHRPLLKSWNDTLSDATDIVLTLALYLHAGEDEPSLLEETEWSTRQ